LIRSTEKLGTDNELFAEINQEVTVVEYYNYRTKEFIYALGKVNGMINAFKGLEIAIKYGFDEATIDRFVYSTLNPDHFTLEPIDDNDPLFTIVIESGNKKFEAAHFKKLEDAGFTVREKYIPSKNRWTYSVGLTENIAEANRIAELAKQFGYNNAEISRFIYMPLSEDKYYLSEMEDIETAFMLEIAHSKLPISKDSSYFDNVKGVYGVSEVYDPNDKLYKYYVGKAIYDKKYAEDFKKELVAMGYEDVRISKFVYSALEVDEYYLEPIEIDDIPFVLEDKDNFELFVYFGFDQYFLTDKALQKLGDFFKVHYNEKYQILLEGYTDSIGDANYNMWLSRKRALSVKKYLLKMGVPESNITLIAKGETEPIFIKPNVEDHKKSRRVLLRSYRKRE
jgi:outer membrane protein OmpA-like peptidoglycan-associated protein